MYICYQNYKKKVLCISYTMLVGLQQHFSLDSTTRIYTTRFAQIAQICFLFLKNFRGSMPPDPPRNARLRRAMQYISCFTWTFGPPLHKFLNTPLPPENFQEKRCQTVRLAAILSLNYQPQHYSKKNCQFSIELGPMFFILINMWY